jgi:hypothetical protein
MVLLYPIRLPPVALASAEPVQLRRDSTEPVLNALANVRPPVNDAAAVITFGAQALGLARSTLPLPRDAAITDRDETNETLLRGLDPNDSETILATGSNVANAALLKALDNDRRLARLTTPGALDQQSGLFAEPQSTRESGFFRSGNAPIESAFPRPPESELESAFPRSFADGTRESGFFRTANAAPESTFPRPPPGELESTFPRAPVNAAQEATRATLANAPLLFTGALAAVNAPTASPRASAETALRPVRALATNAEPFAPRAPLLTAEESRAAVNDTEAAFPRRSLFPSFDSTLARAPAADSETAFPRAPVANNDPAGPFRAPGAASSEAGFTSGRDLNAYPPAAGERSALRAEELNTQQQRQVQTLARNDRAVRADDQAQRALAGGIANGRVQYQMGPDGRRYAVDRQVTFDVTPVPGDPAATLRKMEVVSRAATAPANPSATDRAAAAQAEQLTRQARAQLAAERYTEARELIDRE